jgi:putative nucleotidyltransferase with HDIG domain
VLTLPELAQAKGVTQNRHHEFDVFEHTLRAVDAAPADNALVRWAALLHDLGKPATKALKPDGDASFHGHAQVGAEIALAILERLRVARRESEAIALLVREHLFDYRAEWTDAAVRRFLRRVGEERLHDLFALRVADARATREEPPRLDGLNALEERIARVAEERPPLAARDLAIDGRDVMRELALEPGPAVGAVLERLLEAVLDDPRRNTREELLALARQQGAPGRPGPP